MRTREYYELQTFATRAFGTTPAKLDTPLRDVDRSR
jgi:hypothetical protein